MEQDVWLQKADSNEFNLGFHPQYSFYVLNGDVRIGHVHVSEMKDGYFVEWIMFHTAERKKGFLRKALLAVMDHFHVNKLRLESDVLHKAMYVHLGAVEVDYDSVRAVSSLLLMRVALTKTYRTKTEMIDYFKKLAYAFEVEAHRTGNKVAKGKAEAYELAAFELEHNLK